MDALAILGAAASAVLQVLVLASAGAYLELIGLLGPQRRRVLSDVAFRILLPCLLFTSVCESASIEALTKQYSLPLFMVLYVILGYLMGWLLSFYTTQPDDEFSSTHFIFSCALNNVGYLPLILVPATILQGALHPEGSDLSIEVKRGVSCVGLCILVMNICTWSLAATSLRNVAKRKNEKEQLAASASITSITDSLPNVNPSSAPTVTASSTGGGHKVKGLDTEVRDKYYALFIKYYLPPVIATLFANVMDFIVSVINPPVAGALSGLIIGLISPLRALFFASKPLGLLASSSSNPSGANTMNTVVPHVATLFNMDMRDTNFQTCQNNDTIANTLTMLVRNTTGWFLCSLNAISTVATTTTTGKLFSCCLSLPIVSEIISVTSSQDSHSLLTMIGNNITSELLYSAGMSDSLIDVVNSAAVSAAAIEGINLNNQINTGLATVSNSPKVAPLQPFITSSMQAFASAIIPIVAITLGSNIVAKDTTKIMTNTTAPPVTTTLTSTNDCSSTHPSSSLSPISVSITSPSPFANDSDNDIQIMQPSTSKLGYYVHYVQQKLKLSLILLFKIAIGKDPTDDSQVVRTRVLGGIIFSRMIFMPLVGIVLSYFGSKLGIVPGNDRTLVFVLLVEAATPTAMNLQLISDIMGSGSRAMARVIAVTYVLSVISLTVWISIALALIRNGVFEN